MNANCAKCFKVASVCCCHFALLLFFKRFQYLALPARSLSGIWVILARVLSPAIIRLSLAMIAYSTFRDHGCSDSAAFHETSALHLEFALQYGNSMKNASNIPTGKIRHCIGCQRAVPESR